MRLRNTNPTAVRSVPFTLIELLVVMLIVGILLAVTVPVVVRISSGSSVEAASRMVGSQLRLARQEAITKRRTIAVLFPKTNSTATDVSPTAFVAFRSCYVTPSTSGSYVFDTSLQWVANTSWIYVPVGAVIAEADLDGGPTSPPPVDLDDDGPLATDPGDAMTTVSGVDGFAAGALVRAIVFKPSGQLGPMDVRNVTIVEGAVPPGSATPLIKVRDNWINISINPFTGRVTYQRPGE